MLLGDAVVVDVSVDEVVSDDVSVDELSVDAVLVEDDVDVGSALGEPVELGPEVEEVSDRVVEADDEAMATAAPDPTSSAAAPTATSLA